MEIQSYRDKSAMSEAAAQDLIELINQTLSGQPLFSIVLAGGSTPKHLYRLLAGDMGGTIPWGRVHFFWGDERLVPHGHEQSNYRMARENLLEGVKGILQSNIHPVPVDLEDPEACAGAYEQEIISYFASQEMEPRIFDCVLLGMGNDGHTASLFPGSPVLNEKDRLVRGIQPPDMAPRVERVTMTYPALNASKTVFFLISGREKADILKRIQDMPEALRSRYPAAGIKPRGKVIWYVAAND